MSFLLIILIAISLSMDAFSVSLSIGTLGISKKKELALSSIVGMFHFFMPLFGVIVGSIFVKSLNMDSHLLSFVIFFYIAIMMFKDFINEDIEEIKINLIGMFVFAFGVSLDSFGVGFALGTEHQNLILTFLTFTIMSFSFTYLGLKIGNIINSFIGKYSVLLGTIIMLVLAIINFCQFLF